MRSWMMRIHAAHSPITDEVCKIYEAHRPAPTPLRAVG
jgi:5,5'-dehydrodivanillate O-demethylase